MIIYKSEIFNNVKYLLIENENKNTCLDCYFYKKCECDIKINDDCLSYGLDAIWIISKTEMRKQKLKKLNK